MERERFFCQGCLRAFWVEEDTRDADEDQDEGEVGFCPYCGDEVRP